MHRSTLVLVLGWQTVAEASEQVADVFVLLFGTKYCTAGGDLFIGGQSFVEIGVRQFSLRDP